MEVKPIVIKLFISFTYGADIIKKSRQAVDFLIWIIFEKDQVMDRSYLCVKISPESDS